jgi:SAM-dependent methyltransferase
VTRALSFGRAAASYERVRPSYSPEALDLVIERLGLGADAEVLDLGAGTGKLTRALVDRFMRVTAVEPDAAMRAVLSRGTGCHVVLEGRAEEIPLADRSVDAVFAGQAFHWFSTPEAVAEIGRVLRPCGGLVMIWNTWSRPEPPEPEAAQTLIRSVLDQVVRREPVDEGWDAWQRCFDGSAFEAVHEEQIQTRMLDISGEDLVTLTLSTSPFLVLPSDEHERVESELRRLITGDYRLPVETRLYWTRLT